MVLSTMVEVDGEWHDITPGYPKVKQQGKKLSVTVRFPPFNSYAVYDPVLRYDDTDAATAPALPLATTLLAAVGAIYAGSPLGLNNE